MKKSHRFLSVLLAICMVVSLLPSVLAANGDAETRSDPVQSEDGYQFVVLSTTDMHGRSTVNDVSTQKEDLNSMERVATVVKAERETFGDNMILIDNGDTIQGTLVAQYAITQQYEKENPMLTAMKEIGYDVWVMGNHEFNFTPAQRDAQTRMADESGIAVLSGNLVLQNDGKDFRGNDVKAGATYYDPYVIKTLDAGNGRTVRVAVIGLGNAANGTWDLATNYPNLQFSSLDNPDGLLENEINYWTKVIADQNLADIIIVSAHSGKGTDDGIESDGFMLESQALTAAKNGKNLDLLIYGHDHRANIETVTNADGKEIYMVDGGGNTVTKNVFTVTFGEDGSVADFTVTAEALPLNETAVDAELGQLLQPWYDDAYAWASKPLGVFNNGWNDYTAEAEGKSNNDMVLQQTALMDLVHKAQIWASWQSYDTDAKIEGATVSMASPVFGTNPDRTLSFVPKDGDTVSTLELSKLYRYSNNLLCAIDMTGQQLYNWMSAVADMYTLKDGQVTLGEGVSIYGVDTFYGVDYTIDLTKPEGQRLTASIGGVDLLSYDKPIRVTLNSYRLSGGYGFFEATGLTEADCCWTASEYLGADRAPVPTQIGEYVAHMQTVSPKDAVSHGIDSTWKIVTAVDPCAAFTDIDRTQWYHDGIDYMVENGLMIGTGKGAFRPESKLTRGMMAVILYRAAGEPEVTGKAPFADVAADAWYADAVAWGFEEGIIEGVSATSFAPDEAVTREQLVTFLYRYAGTPDAGDPTLDDYADGNKVSEYARDAMVWALNQGIVKGFSSTTLAPRACATRAQVAVMVCRYLTLG